MSVKQCDLLREIADVAAIGLKGHDAEVARGAALNAVMTLSGSNGNPLRLNSRILFKRRDGSEFEFDAWIAVDVARVLSTGGGG